MRRIGRVGLATSLGVFVVLSACGGDKAQTRPDDKPTVKAEPTSDAKPTPASAGPAEKHELRLLFTTDEHGWLEPFMDRAAGVRRGGVLEAYDVFTRVEGLGRDDVLLLSAGDMWTGPYETTVLEGGPMVKAFNRMGYKASAVGNHEFDFGIRVLEKRSGEAGFPFLAANIREAATGTTPTWCQPSMILEKAGLKIGVVGLVYQKSPQATDPKHLVGLEFLDYGDALRAEVPKLRAAGAEEVIVLMHDRLSAGTRLASTFRELGINVVAVGHAHRSNSFVDLGGTPQDTSDDIVFCNAGAYLRSYCRVDLTFTGEQLTFRQVSVQELTRPIAAPIEKVDPELEEIIKSARAASAKIGGEILVRSERRLQRKDDSLGQFIVDTWLASLPYAQVAITNAGGIRQDLPRGKVRVRDVASVMPFNNYLLVVELTGAQLREVLSNPESVQGGLKFTYRDSPGGRVILEMTDLEGKSIGDDTRVKVVINDFMYRGGDGYTFLKMDRNPEETAIDWREPVLRALRDLGRAEQKLDYKPDERARSVE